MNNEAAGFSQTPAPVPQRGYLKVKLHLLLVQLTISVA
jgi:hypothetical protein